MSVTHVAGPVVAIKGRGVQRCMVCGEKLRDSLGEAAPVGPDGEEPEMMVFGTGRLIRVVKGRMTDVGSYMDVESLPNDNCWSLVE